MTTRTRMNVYFDPALLKQVEALALRRNISKSAIVEAAVASFLSGDTSEKLEAAMSRRLDRLGRQIGTLDEDLAVLGETVSLFVNIWLASTPPLPESAQASARAKGAERFERFHADARQTAREWRQVPERAFARRGVGTRWSCARRVRDEWRSRLNIRPVLFTADGRRSPHALR